MSPFTGLAPAAVWRHFATLCEIPRPSAREAAVREHLITWARQQGLPAEVDAAGNLLLRKPASPGAAARPGVVLQGHLDMVCQANSGTRHDFTRDPIRPKLEAGWLLAPDTTLGADNGVGVALALAALEDRGLEHPPLEALFTVSEETGMDGARSLAPGTLRGRYLLNLDTEDWGHFYLGCAGGLDLRVRRQCRLEGLPRDFEPLQLALTGLRGGHSGVDIHLGRGNAIRLLAEALRELATQVDLRLLGFNGGTARNAIPREAFALIAVPPGAAGRLKTLAAGLAQRLRGSLAGVDEGLDIGVQPAGTSPPVALDAAERSRLLTYLATVPDGVAAMSADFPGVVETSVNLGVVGCQDGQWQGIHMVRSLKDAGARSLADALAAHAAGNAVEAEASGAYPGWTPDPASPLLALCRSVYKREFGADPGLRIIHAGLECGLFAASHPGLDMISFGPDIRGAHAPGERVEVQSVERCWQLLKALLRELAQG